MVATLNALLHCVIAFVPLFVAFIVLRGAIPWSLVFLPLYLFPLTLFAVGFSLTLSALGVFIRDIEAFMQPLLTILMFGSAVFYPVKAIPESYRWFVQMNPLTLIIETARLSLICGVPPNLGLLLVLSCLALIFVVAASTFFDKSKPAFADVM